MTVMSSYFSPHLRRAEFKINSARSFALPLPPKALRTVGIHDYKFVTYREHAVSEGADSKAISYIQLTAPDGRTVFGVGMDGNISLASIKGIICAINRACSEQKDPEGEAK